MSQLAAAIIAQGLTGTAAEIAAAFAADVTIKDDPTLYTVGQLEVVFAGDLTKQRLVIGTLNTMAAQDALVDAYRLKFVSGNGLPFNLPNTQDLIGQLAALGNWPSDVTAAVKAIGIETGPRWQAAGLDALPTEQACQAALDQIATAEWWAHVTNDIVPPLLTANAPKAEIITAIQGA